MDIYIVLTVSTCFKTKGLGLDRALAIQWLIHLFSTGPTHMITLVLSQPVSTVAHIWPEVTQHKHIRHQWSDGALTRSGSFFLRVTTRTAPSSLHYTVLTRVKQTAIDLFRATQSHHKTSESETSVIWVNGLPDIKQRERIQMRQKWQPNHGRGI